MTSTLEAVYDYGYDGVQSESPSTGETGELLQSGELTKTEKQRACNQSERGDISG